MLSQSYKKEIHKWREKYESVANENGQDHPIMIEGETTAGYYCQLMVNPQEVAKIFVDYDYALYHVLGEDAPDEMWEDLGRKFGLEHVCSVDLWKPVKSATNAPNAANTM